MRGKPTIFSKSDSVTLQPHLTSPNFSLLGISPIESPSSGSVLPLNELIKRLNGIIGFEFEDLGGDQERNRGGVIHTQVCKLLGYKLSEDNGQFPDILNQLLEVKLQTSPTIDLGLVLPSSEESFLKIGKSQIRHCDVRYAIVVGTIKSGRVRITNYAIGIGADFFKEFKIFEGKGINKKIQIPLPKDFFKS